VPYVSESNPWARTAQIPQLDHDPLYRFHQRQANLRVMATGPTRGWKDTWQHQRPTDLDYQKASTRIAGRDSVEGCTTLQSPRDFEFAMYRYTFFAAGNRLTESGPCAIRP
jgi:hypothetical protein